MNAARSRWVRTAMIAVVASGLSVLATSVVVNAQGGSAEQIHACADARGTLRKVEATEPCASGENRVTWNVQGPQGAAGPGGPAGPEGAAGQRGLQGAKGKKGKVKLKLTGDLGTQLILGRLKKLDKKITALDADLNNVKKTVHYNKGYMNVILPAIQKYAGNGCVNAQTAAFLGDVDKPFGLASCPGLSAGSPNSAGGGPPGFP